MKKNILKVNTDRYEKLPAWLQVILSSLMAVAFFFGGSILAGIVLGIFVIPFALSNPSLVDSIGDFLSSLHVELSSFLFIALLLFAWVKWFEKRPISSLGFFKEKPLKEFLKGWLVGMIVFSVAFLLTYLLGGVQLLAYDFSGKTILYVLSTIPFWIIQGGTEEIITRGWLLPILNKRTNLAIAVAVSSSLFGLLHLGNDNVTVLSVAGIILAGVFMALYMLKTDNLWGVVGLHAAWNFIQGNVYGIAVSGVATGPSFFRFIGKPSVPDWISGGAFGTEGSLLTSIVLLICIFYLAWLLKKEKQGE